MEKELNDYLEKVEKHLKPLPVSERIDIVQEIKSEILELRGEGGERRGYSRPAGGSPGTGKGLPGRSDCEERDPDPEPRPRNLCILQPCRTLGAHCHSGIGYLRTSVLGMRSHYTHSRGDQTVGHLPSSGNSLCGSDHDRWGPKSSGSVSLVRRDGCATAPDGVGLLEAVSRLYQGRQQDKGTPGTVTEQSE